MDTNIIIGLIGALLGFLTGFLTSYFKEKGKNQALVEDLKRITEEKEKVSSKYQLDISKRKYKYEDKRTQYFKYFNLLDKLSAEGGKEALEDFVPAIGEFNNKFLIANGDRTKELKATADFNDAVNKLMFKSSESLIKLKRETSTLKLIAGETVLNVLEELEIAYDMSLDRSSEMMKELSNNIILRKQYAMEAQQREVYEIGGKILMLQKKLIEEVRKELDEI
ncbi:MULTISPECIES: hypothetical protein [unclassified Aquimarina]|uniref:hypothetical protein n=1 Tax=unclassified Aquimarina TaxID=2627091 RepID=UPI0018CA0FA3|nr:MULTISPECIES: hypothetical protein [unclassified Aquimarina]MBG6130729.1 hypothetical protein [Aquimarina sp. EL_35]MBG6151125.1 hypothetical protein [Aquimarina sp. EL_32]